MGSSIVKRLETFIFSLMIILPNMQCEETFCPPPLSKFLKINRKNFRSSRERVIYMNEVAEEEVVRLSLRDNPYYSSPKCSVLETDNNMGYKHIGIQEE